MRFDPLKLDRVATISH